MLYSVLPDDDLTCIGSWQVLHAFERWHAQHAVSVRALLEVRSEGSLAGPLAERLINVVVHLSELFRLKAAVVSKLLPL